MVRLCFVCLGNICRSPTAEGVMRKLVETQGLRDQLEIDSAGTTAHHVGQRADSRSRESAKRKGLTLRSVARQFVADDFDRFDYVLAMDTQNYEDLLFLSRSESDRKALHLFRSFDPESDLGAGVPDPYYGGDNGFDEVLDLCEAACIGLIYHLRATKKIS